MTLKSPLDKVEFDVLVGELRFPSVIPFTELLNSAFLEMAGRGEEIGEGGLVGLLFQVAHEDREVGVVGAGETLCIQILGREVDFSGANPAESASRKQLREEAC